MSAAKMAAVALSLSEGLTSASYVGPSGPPRDSSSTVPD